MAAWHRARRADLGLRALGSGVCGVAGLAAQRLGGLAVPPHAPSLLAVALATLAFLCASAGSALLLLGAHLFDQVAVSARWRRAGRADPAGRPVARAETRGVTDPGMRRTEADTMAPLCAAPESISKRYVAVRSSGS